MDVKKETGMPIVTEIMAPRYVELFSEKADIIQIGARNMQNFDLLKEVGQTKKPILLKRGLSSTIEELLMSAEDVYKRQLLPFPVQAWELTPKGQIGTVIKITGI